MSDGISANRSVSLEFPFCGEHDLISAVILRAHQNAGVKLNLLFAAVSSASDVFGFCRLQGDSLAPPAAEEEPAPKVPEQAVPEVTCE